jgi:hypothetical protein
MGLPPPNGAGTVWGVIIPHGIQAPGYYRARRNAAGGGVTVQEVDARLRREPKLDKLDPKLVEALARGR